MYQPTLFGLKNKKRIDVKIVLYYGIGEDNWWKTSIIGYIITQKNRFVNILFENF